MASRGILRRCSSASCSACGSLPSTSTASVDLFRTFSGSNVRGCGNGSVAGEGEHTGRASIVCSAVGQRSASDAFPDHASGAAAGDGRWRSVIHLTGGLCTKLSQGHDLRKLPFTNFGHLELESGQWMRAHREWRIDPAEPISSAANEVKFGFQHRLSQWQVAKNGSVWLVRSRASSTVDARALTTSASGEEQRRRGQEYADSDSQMEHTEEDDLDYYMKSRYDLESLRSSETESETESEEELLTEPAQSEAPEDLLWKLKPNERGKFDNVVAVLGDPRVLAAAHERLNQRRRNWTLASNELEISHVPRENRLLRARGIDYNWFKEAAHQLRTGSYTFEPVKRLDVARRGRGGPRQWMFVRPKDQVIQEAIRVLLERIYEPVFAVHDSGFRPGSSVHSALKSVKYGWRGISWFLQFDVRITDHESVQKRLLQLLAEQIEDEVFFDALRQMFKVGTIWIETNADKEKPDGSVLSPMLADIYFHRLDLEISRIREEINNESQALRK